MHLLLWSSQTLDIKKSAFTHVVKNQLIPILTVLTLPQLPLPAISVGPCTIHACPLAEHVVTAINICHFLLQEAV